MASRPVLAMSFYDDEQFKYVNPYEEMVRLAQ
jgi:hypothetical protein